MAGVSSRCFWSLFFSLHLFIDRLSITKQKGGGVKIRLIYLDTGTIAKRCIRNHDQFRDLTIFLLVARAVLPIGESERYWMAIMQVLMAVAMAVQRWR